MQELIKIMKMNDEAFPEEIPMVDDTIDEVRKTWNETTPYTTGEVLKKYSNNAEKLMTIFRILDPAKVFAALDAKKLKERVITKNQTRLSVNKKGTIETEDYTYKDKYILWSINPKKMGLTSSTQIKMVEMDCTTTDHKFYLYVPSWIEDPIEGVRWTMPIPKGRAFKSVKRQGDVLIYDLLDKSIKSYPSIDYLTEKEYLDMKYES